MINGGTLQLGSAVGNNPILVNPTATVPTVLDLQLNDVGSTLDLNGNSQAVGRLSSINPLAGQAGNIINQHRCGHVDRGQKRAPRRPPSRARSAARAAT